jgi:hypothetical protein
LYRGGTGAIWSGSYLFLGGKSETEGCEEKNTFYPEGDLSEALGKANYLIVSKLKKVYEFMDCGSGLLSN